jgi:hypothetical protein
MFSKYPPDRDDRRTVWTVYSAKTKLVDTILALIEIFKEKRGGEKPRWVYVPIKLEMQLAEELNKIVDRGGRRASALLTHSAGRVDIVYFEPRRALLSDAEAIYLR